MSNEYLSENESEDKFYSSCFGKEGWRNKRKALEIQKMVNERNKRYTVEVYRCEFCSKFHLSGVER